METADYKDALNIDMNRFNRMPNKEFRVIDDDERKKLLEKQTTYSFIDGIIIFLCIAMAIFSPIEHDITDELLPCISTRWEYWCFIELGLATISLALDQITYQKVKKNFVAKWTTYLSLFVDFL
jgi:hypothetical protein